MVMVWFTEEIYAVHNQTNKSSVRRLQDENAEIYPNALEYAMKLIMTVMN